MSKNLITLLLALSLLMGNNPKITENETTVSEVESQVTTVDTEEPFDDSQSSTVDKTIKETVIVEATEAVDKSDLWTLGGITFIMNEEGQFLGVRGKNTKNIVILGHDIASTLRSSVDYGVRFIPKTYYKDAERTKDAVETEYRAKVIREAIKDEIWYSDAMRSIKKKNENSEDEDGSYVDDLYALALQKFSESELAEFRAYAEEWFGNKEYYVITSLSLYDKYGNPLKGITTEDALYEYVKQQKTADKEAKENAQVLDGTYKLSSLKEDTYYAVNNEGSISIENDMGIPYEVVEYEWSDVLDEWGKDHEELLHKAFTSSVPDYEIRGVKKEIDGCGKLIKVYTKSFKLDKDSIINDDDCIKVSELSSTPYDTFAKHYIYNDTNSDVTISYIKGQSKSSVVMPKGELWDFNWMQYDDLTV